MSLHSVDPDQTLHFTVSDLGLHSLEGLSVQILGVNMVMLGKRGVIIDIFLISLS